MQQFFIKVDNKVAYGMSKKTKKDNLSET